MAVRQSYIFYLPLKRLPKIPRTSLLPIWLPTVRVAELTALSNTLSNTLLVWRPLLLCAARSAAMRSRSAALAARSASLACLASSFSLSAPSLQLQPSLPLRLPHVPLLPFVSAARRRIHGQQLLHICCRAGSL